MKTDFTLWKIFAEGMDEGEKVHIKFGFSLTYSYL